MASALLLLPDRNLHGHDYSGAFLPQAEKFEEFLTDNYPQLDVYRQEIDISQGFRNSRKQVLESIYGQEQLALMAFLCHGEEEWLQLGFTDSSIGLVADAVDGRAASYLHIAIYACSTAKDEEPGPGIAEGLAIALGKIGCTGHVDGHANLGHATVNPNVIRFSFDPQGVEQEWLVDPNDDSHFAQWQRLLRRTDLRFRYTMERTRERVLEYVVNSKKAKLLAPLTY